MNVCVNGAWKTFSRNATIGTILADIGVNPASVVVEYNREIYSREDRNEQRLSEGDILEVVTFVGGGRG